MQCVSRGINQTYVYKESMYTGTDIQPDLISVFVRRKRDLSDRMNISHACSYASHLAFYPGLSLLLGAERVIRAVMKVFDLLIFSKAQDKGFQYWNAIKNFLRGIVEILPLTWIFLKTYDYLRMKYVERKIRKLVETQNDLVGVAVDGNVVFTMPLATLKNFRNDQNEYRNKQILKYFSKLCLKALKIGDPSRNNYGIDSSIKELKSFKMNSGWRSQPNQSVTSFFKIFEAFIIRRSKISYTPT